MNAAGIIAAMTDADTDVQDLCGGRIYALIAPQGATLPFVVAQVVAIEPNDTHTGASKEDTGMVQVDNYALKMSDAERLADTIRRAIDKQRGSFTVGGAGVDVDGVQFITERQMWDDDAECYRVSHDFRLRVRRDTDDLAPASFVRVTYADDAAAAAGGVAIGQTYVLSINNPYGMAEGTLKVRIE